MRLRRAKSRIEAGEVANKGKAERERTENMAGVSVAYVDFP